MKFNMDNNTEELSLSAWEKKLESELREEYQGWKRHVITKLITGDLEKEKESISKRLNRVCLQCAYKIPVDNEEILYLATKNRVIDEILRIILEKSL